MNGALKNALRASPRCRKGWVRGIRVRRRRPVLNWKQRRRNRAQKHGLTARLSPAFSIRPRNLNAWTAGHYWTIYFVCIAAGLKRNLRWTTPFTRRCPIESTIGRDRRLDATQEGFAFFENYRRSFWANRVLRTKVVKMGLHAFRDGVLSTKPSTAPIS